MPEVTQVHVDAALTQVSVAYRNPEYIADAVAPAVPVRKQSDKYFVMDAEREAMRATPDQRAPGAEASEVDFRREHRQLLRGGPRAGDGDPRRGARQRGPGDPARHRPHGVPHGQDPAEPRDRAGGGDEHQQRDPVGDAGRGGALDERGRRSAGGVSVGAAGGLRARAAARQHGGAAVRRRTRRSATIPGWWSGSSTPWRAC